MSKNVALILSELVVAIVFATVVPDWECKSRKFILIYKRWSKNYFHELKKYLKSCGLIRSGYSDKPADKT
jgi:hypothetical protein